MNKEYERLKQLKIDLKDIGFEQCGEFIQYYCTPEGAEIIGAAGIDGIHYCTIPQFGDIIFAVSPMNFGDCVHPIARSFKDMLRLLLSGADMAALEQCHAWDKQRFQAFLADNPTTAQQQAALDAIKREFALEPIKQPFEYIKALQAEFDLSKIPYGEDYYDIDMNPAAPLAEEWKVTYDGGFTGSGADAGIEISINKSFYWNGRAWLIPAAYICSQGIVIDHVIEADIAAAKAFIEKWQQYEQGDIPLTAELEEQLERENPLAIDFRAKVCCNEQMLQTKHSRSAIWMDGYYNDPEALHVIEHYGLDKSKALIIRREAYRFTGEAQKSILSLKIHLEPTMQSFTAMRFNTPGIGQSISIKHPFKDQSYTLTIHEAEKQKLPAHVLGDDSNEYPSHFWAISYSLEPEIPARGFMLRDTAPSDAPRPKASAARGIAPSAQSSISIGIIGGADGPTAIAISSGAKNIRSACSSPHFEPAENVTWQAIFNEKIGDEIDIRLI